ncbi:MAG TPA: beta-ketoacyl synthase N-terminal-like domain-containing protein [Conexibacter sp.]|nr:beta-ketoacyl synthase N-terminal-like domain-containing protein [Conexibacter sp.]
MSMVGTITGVGVVSADELATPAVAELLQGERLRSLNPETKLLLAAARLALRDAGLVDGVVHPDELGVVVATRHAGLQDYVELFLAGIGGDDARVNPARGPQTGLNAPAAHLSIRLPAAGPNATLTSGAAAGLDALRYATDALTAKRAIAMLVCGVDVVPAIVRSPSARPGGAAVLVVEAEGVTRAPREGIRVGVAAVATAYSPRDDVDEASERALRDALRDAQLAPDAVRSSFTPRDADGEGVGALAQLALAVGSLRRGEATGPVLVHASDESCGAGAAVLVAYAQEGALACAG